MKKLLSPAVLTASLMFVVACSAARASEPMLLSSVVDQSSTAASSDSTIPSDHPAPHPYELLIGPEASVFFPSSSKTSDAYGSTWTSFGVGLGSAYQASAKGSFSPFFNVLYNTHDSNRAFVLPVGIAYSKSLTASASSAYYGFDLVGVGVDQRDVSVNVHSGFAYGEGARAVLGYEIGRNAFAQVSYMVTSSIKSFNFSGAAIETGFRF